MTKNKPSKPVMIYRQANLSNSLSPCFDPLARQTDYDSCWGGGGSERGVGERGRERDGVEGGSGCRGNEDIQAP